MSAICGLVDFTGRPLSFCDIAAVAEAGAYRGPDGLRHRSGGGVVLCHLALDTTFESSLERQPLSTFDCSVFLVGDVRLDNRGELLEALEPKGFLPSGRTIGDGEIVLSAYLLWRESCVERLLGDFAFAVWDSRCRKLLCARDALGIRPLCFARLGDLFCFATEAQQILHHPAADRSLNELAVADYLAGKPQDPARSFFQQVQRLPPGHRITVTSSGERLERFWAPDQIEPELRRNRKREAEAAGQFLETLQQAVIDRLRTRIGTVGLALSGGLDSTSVAVLTQAHLQHLPAPAQLVAYSFVFDRLTECDERAYIRPLAEAMGFQSFLVSAEDHWLLDHPGLYAASLESPFAGWLSPHREGLRVLGQRGTRVLLTGQGADDLLQGSPGVLPERLLQGDLRVAWEVWRYAAARGRNPLRDLYRLLLRPLLPVSADTRLRRLAAKKPIPASLPTWISQELVQRTGLVERLAEHRLPARVGMAHRQIALHFESPPYEQAIHWLDRIAAPFGVEVRHPFTDRRLAEAVLSTPPDQIFELGCYKPLLRRAMAGRLPDALRLRPTKTKLGAYFDYSLREKSSDLLDRLLACPLIAELGWVDGSELRAAFQAYRQGDSERMHRKIWNAATLELWIRQHSQALGLGHPDRPRDESVDARRLALAT